MSNDLLLFVRFNGEASPAKLGSPHPASKRNGLGANRQVVTSNTPGDQ